MSKIIKCACVQETPKVIDRPVLELVKQQLIEPPTALQEECVAAKLDAQAIIADAQRQAEDILGQARENAVTLTDNTEKLAEQMKIQGHQEGYQAGYEEGLGQGKSEGYQQGLLDAQQEFSAKIQEANQLIIRAQNEAKEIILSSERQIVAIALELARKILANEIKENSMVVLPIIKKALEKVRDQEQITVKVNPQDFQLVQESKINLQTSIGCDHAVTILADESISAGGCSVETANGSINAKIDTQFALLKKAIEDQLP